MRNWLGAAGLLLLGAIIASLPSGAPLRAQFTGVCNVMGSCAQSQGFLSQANTNANTVTGGRTGLTNVIALNTTTVEYFLKLYDKATAPTCGTDTPKKTYPVPYGANNSGGGFAFPRFVPVQFTSGMGFCLTGGINPSDTTPAAAGLSLDFEYLN